MKPEPELGALLSGLFWFSSKNFLNKSLNSSGKPGGVWNWFCPFELDTVLVAFTITTAGMFSSTMFVKSGYDTAEEAARAAAATAKEANEKAAEARKAADIAEAAAEPWDEEAEKQKLKEAEEK